MTAPKPALVLVVVCMLLVSHAAITRAMADGWEASAGAIFLNRDAHYDGYLVVDNGHNPLLSSSDFETGVQGGFLATLSKDLHDSYSVQARYFAIDDWSETDSTATTNGAWLFHGATLGSATITQIDGTFTSNLNSIEVNLGHQHNDWIKCLAGFRYLSIDESLHFDFFDGMIDYSDYEGSVNNDLYGVQAGAEVLLLDRGGPLTVDGIFRAGIYRNEASYDGVYANGMSAQVVDSASQTAFVGEIGINANLLLTDNVEFNAGYNMLWVSGISLLEEQLAAANWMAGTGINTDGSAFYHGASATFTIYH